jgi:hypothetical protein
MAMARMQIANESVMVAVFDDTKVNFQLAAEGIPDGRWLTRRNRLVEVDSGLVRNVPYPGIYCYHLPTAFESLTVRKGGERAPAFQGEAGTLPDLLVDADLAMYPCLHFLAEKKVAAPWRMERWYTLVGPYLVFECQQYFELPGGRDDSPLRSWERIISELQQVVDVVAWGTGREVELHSVIGGPRDVG